SVLEPLTPAVDSPLPTPPVILSEPVVAPKTVELKPSAEPTAAAAPVVLGPPPAAEAPSVPTPSPDTIPPTLAEPSAVSAAPIAEAPVPIFARVGWDSKPAVASSRPALESEPIQPALITSL